MLIKQILVVKETSEGECRVALTPEAVGGFVSKGYRALVESQAGCKAGFEDSDYINAGAEIFAFTSAGFPANTLILRVKRANEIREGMENKLFRENTAVFGFLDPVFLDPSDSIAEWQMAKIHTYSVGLLKSVSVHDPKNVQAAMSRIAGRLAFRDAKRRYAGKKPITLTVIGTGPAAFSAALEARKQGITVQLFGRQERYRLEFESQGIAYFVLPVAQNQARSIGPYLSEQTIVITAARTVGERAPLLMDEINLSVLPEGAIVVDLAISDGGNVVGSLRDQVVVSHGVSIVNLSAYPKAEPKTASEAYSKCMVHLLAEVLTPEGELLVNHELLQECWVTRDGERHGSLFEGFN